MLFSLLALVFLSSSQLVSAKPSAPYANQTKRVSLDGNKDISFIAIGDWGSRRDRQDEVAQAMGLWCSHDSHNCDFIMSTGDNIYSSGVESVYDGHFDDTWRDVYTHPGIAELPWYLTVGNHDHIHSNGEWFQVGYSLRNSRWNMPSLAFAFEMASEDTTVKFVSFDAISITEDKNEASSMISLLSSELANADSSGWKVAFGHYPCHSGGHYGGSHTLREKVLPILKRNYVDFYITGHDHNQQHWVTRGDAGGLEHVTTGAGGQSRYHQHDDNVSENEKLGMELKFFDAEEYGFAYFVIRKEEMIVQFVNTYLEVVYESVRHK